MPLKRNEKYKLPVPLPEGKVLDDTEGKQWVLGKMIGSGGFGLIYLAFPTNKQDGDARHVIKVEYQENGPLFSELKFYQRAAKKDCIKKWIELRQLDYLGIPLFYGSGITEFKGRSYRFMVMERLGMDLQKISDQHGTFKKSTVLQLGLRMLDVLEYIHENEYVHGDIKAANLLLGYKSPDRVYLADYGLSYRYCPNGNHKQYQENPRKGHNGTIEFTSLDAHKGVGEIAQFLSCVHSLAYDEKPNYQRLKKILNPSGIPLGPLEFSTNGPSVNVHTPINQKADSRKAATRQVYQIQNKLKEKARAERSAERFAAVRRPQTEAERIGLGAAQESTRRRQKYHKSSELLNEVNSFPQESSYTYFQNSFHEPYQDFTISDRINELQSPSWNMYTSTTGVEVTDLAHSAGFWSTIFQFTLSEETMADVYFYGTIIFSLLILVCLAVYFL